MTRNEIKALGYRVLCSLGKRRLTTILLIVIPILLALSLIQFISQSGSHEFEPAMVPTLSMDTIIKIANKNGVTLALVVSPNNADIMNLMNAATSRLTVTSLVFMATPEDVLQHVSQLYKQSKTGLAKDTIFGVDFETLTPQNLIYSIRSTESYWHTSEKFPKKLKSGPMENGENYLKGFLALQMLINYSYITVHLKSIFPDLLIQPFPYPRYRDTDNNNNSFVQSVLWLSIIFISAVFATLLIQEKASGIREMLKVNGVKTWMIYASWFIPFGIITFIIAVVTTMLWKIAIVKEAVFPDTNGLILFSIILIFFWSALCSVAFIAAFINSPKYGILIIIVYWLASLVITSALLNYITRNEIVLILLAFLPFGGLSECLEAIYVFGTSGRSTTFSSMFTAPLGSLTILPVGVTLLLMILSMFIYLVAMLYVDAVKPGQYGRAKPWYFIFPGRRNAAGPPPPKPNQVQPMEKRIPTTGSNMNTRSKEIKPIQESDLESQQTSQLNMIQSALVEPLNEEAAIGIKTEKLVKSFGKFRAVDNLSITMLKNEITVLLGHNGAGKTTLFCVICGMYSPTSGNVYTENYNVFAGKNIDTFRKELGYCPQYNLLLVDLTAKQHLVFFGMLKGLDYADAKKNSDQLTTKFKMHQSRDKVPSKLSGGMKRKLCLSIAMIGKPKFLLLDEPTSGLDPESRREVWDILLETRGIRTTVITTHYMEEADVLADRIAIIVQGKLKCYGTTMFLKQQYGVGYQLNCATEGKDVDKLLAMVQKYIPSAKLVSKTDRTVSISLPASEVNKFPALLQAVSGETDATLSSSTMDDVFLRVQEDQGVYTTVTEMPIGEEIEKSKYGCCRQQEALFIKRIKWWCHNWKIYILLLIILPAAVTFLAIHESKNVVFNTEKVEKLSLTLDTYKGGSCVVAKRQTNDQLAAFIESRITANGLSFVNVAPHDEILNYLHTTASNDLMNYRINEIVAYDTRGPPKALFSTLAYHSLPIAYGVLVNAMINHLNAKIRTYNFPYKFEQTDACKGNSSSFEVVILWALVFALPMLIATSYYIFFPHTERVTGFKHLQLMTGVWPLFYWLPLLIIDFIIFLITIAVVIFVIIISDSYHLFDTLIFLQVLTLGLVLYGISSITLAYFCSFFFRNYSSAMLFYISVSLFGTIASLVLTLRWPSTWKMEYTYFLPWAILVSYLNKIITWSVKVGTCKTCHETSEAATCDEMKNATLKTFQLNREIMFFIIDALFYLFLAVCLDHRLWNLIKAPVEKILYGKINDEQDAKNPDVVKEKERIRNIVAKNQNENVEIPIFICNNLGKKYSKKLVAVNDVTFGVQKGECFGILGVNGAGKSTTFGMLTALIIPTKGNARIEKSELSWYKSHNYLRKLGYCPQQDGLLLELSAKSLITIFGLLRGMPYSQARNMTQKWINALDMREICDRPCKNYSEGNRRKLSTALAMLGNPPVVLLDEPTTGVDPVIRRKIWAILRYCLENNKQTIILTSHSMDECEAVCGRITIMVRGVMRCIGTVPSLKKQYGKGCILQVKLLVSTTDDEINNIQTLIESKFAPYIELKEKQHSLLTFYISSEKIKIHEMFEIMNAIKRRNKNIEDFTLTDVTLEHVFLSFANTEN